jgi:mono/diheme cytochrome c family protein
MVSALAAFLIVLGIDTASADPDPQQTIVEIGKEYYIQYCAACHGRFGKGDGPLASVLRDEMKDLRTIAQRQRDGQFPDAYIARTIDGREPIRAHGTRDMPVWGRSFSRDVASGPGKPIEVRGRILFLVEYLRSIQRE